MACYGAVKGALPIGPFLCTWKGARLALVLKANKLSDVCAHLGIDLQHHHAGSDAEAAAGIYAHLRAMGVSDVQLALR